MGGNRWGCHGYLTLCKSSTCLSAWRICAQRTGHCFSPSPPPPSFLQTGPPRNQQGCGTHGTRRPAYSLGVTSDQSFFDHTPQSALRQRGQTSFGMLASCSGSLRFPSYSKLCKNSHPEITGFCHFALWQGRELRQLVGGV